MQVTQTWGVSPTNPANHVEKRCNTVSEIMSILNVGNKAVYSLIRKKAFPAIRISSVGYRIPKDSFHAWLYKSSSVNK